MLSLIQRYINYIHVLVNILNLNYIGFSDVEAWKELYKRTQGELTKLQEKLLDVDAEHKEKLLQMESRHTNEIEKYQQDIFVLQSKIKNAAASKEVNSSSDAKTLNLVKQIGELESLLAGR